MADVLTDDQPVHRARSPIASRRRNTELTLIVMAGLITAVAYAVAALGTNAEIPPESSCLSASCSACWCARTSSCVWLHAAPTAHSYPLPHSSTASAS